MSTPLTKHLCMDSAVTERYLDDQQQGVIGKPLDRPEGPLKVTGAATYAGEWSQEELGSSRSLAHGVLVRATITKGKVVAIARRAVEAMPGVLAVIDDERLLRVPAQGTANKAPSQGPREVEYFGQPIALVVAESFEQARHGAHQLEVTYRAEDGAAVDPCDDQTTIDLPEKKQLDQGDMDLAMAQAEHRVDVTYTTPAQSSAALEPHASIAVWRTDDTGEDDSAGQKHLTLYGSYQMLKYNRNELADSLGIAPERVRMLSPYVGGGFGSKLGIAPEAVAAAIAAELIGRPVKVVMTRPQVFEATVRRSETHQRIRLAADAEGKLTGVAHEARVSNLPGQRMSEPVAAATRFLYGGENRQIVHEVARLNLTCAGSVRAPGEAVGMLALENAMDELAEVAGIDPIELRKRNLPERHPEKGIPYSSRYLAEALDEGAKRFGWDQRSVAPCHTRDGEWWVGMGVASAARGHFHTRSEARVTLRPDATATVATDMTDIGTGTYAILGQIAGEMLGLDPKHVSVELGDTNLPPGAGSGGSWGAASSGSSVLLACQALREQLAKK